MSDLVTVALITTVGGVVVAYVGKTRRSTKADIGTVLDETKAVHVLVDGRLTRVLELGEKMMIEIAELRDFIDSDATLKPGQTSEQVVARHTDTEPLPAESGHE